MHIRPAEGILLDLAKSRNLAMLDRHAALGRPILIRDMHGYFGTHMAASRGNIDVVEWFLGHGIDINVADRKGLTFGLVGACSGYFDILRLFVDLGGNEESLEYLGMNALQKSIFFGESDADILTMINDAEHSSLLTARTSHFGFHACHFAAHFGRLNVLRALVAAGVDPDATSKEGLTPFHLAAQRGHLDVMKYLYSIGVNVNAKTLWRKNAADFVAALGNVELLIWLNSVSVDMSYHFLSDHSILTYAIEANQYDCCRWMLEEGGYHHLLEDNPNSDLEFAFRTQNLPIARLLFSHGASLRNPMTLACSCFHAGLLDLCAEFGPVSANCGSIALRSQDWDAFDWSISHGYFSWAETAFQVSHWSLPVEAFREVKQRGFDFHVLNEKDQNLFISTPGSTLFNFLIEEGLDPNVVNCDGNVAWLPDFSVAKKHRLVVIGACNQLHQGFVNYVESEAQTIDMLPESVDIWSTTTDVANAARLRLLAIHAILNCDESTIVNINQRYPLTLGAAAIVIEHGVETLISFGIEVDFDKLQTALEEQKFTYLANRCREEKSRSLILLNHMQLL